MEHLADYDFTVKHIRGAENGAADGLSRQPEQRAEYNAAATTTTLAVSVPGANEAALRTSPKFANILSIVKDGQEPGSDHERQRASHFQWDNTTKALYVKEVSASSGSTLLRRCVVGDNNVEAMAYGSITPPRRQAIRVSADIRAVVTAFLLAQNAEDNPHLHATLRAVSAQQLGSTTIDSFRRKI